MVSCRVVGLQLLLFFAALDPSAAFREVSGEQLKKNVRQWIHLQKDVVPKILELKHNANPPKNPFALSGFLSPNHDDGSAVILAAKNIVPDIHSTMLYNDLLKNTSSCKNFEPPGGFARDPVPLFTIAVISNVTTGEKGDNATQKFLPYICALRRQTEMIIFLNISQSLVAPPLGDLCNTMILIRQAFHSARFLATIFMERTESWKPPLCRPIVWGNLSPYLQFRREYQNLDGDTLVFLGSKGGTINFALSERIHDIGSEISGLPVPQVKRYLSILYATIDNTVQLAFRSSRIGENRMTGPRFAFPDAESMRKRYLVKRRELRDYLVSEGLDLSTINMLQILPVLLFCGAVTMFIAINPQYSANDYVRLVEVVEDEPEEKKEQEKEPEKKVGVLATIKQAMERRIASDNHHSASRGKRGKKAKKAKTTDKTTEKTVMEVTAEGDATVSRTGKPAKGEDTTQKTATQKKSKGGLGSFVNKKRNRKTQEKTSDNELTADNTCTGGTTIGTEATAAATMTAPASN